MTRYRVGVYSDIEAASPEEAASIARAAGIRACDVVPACTCGCGKFYTDEGKHYVFINEIAVPIDSIEPEDARVH